MKKSNYVLLVYFLSLFLTYTKYPSAESHFKFTSYNAFQTVVKSPFNDKEWLTLILLVLSIISYIILRFFIKKYRQYGNIILLTSFIWFSLLQLSPSIIAGGKVYLQFYGIGFWLSTSLGIIFLIMDLLETKNFKS